MMNSEVTIGDNVFTKIHSATIEQSWKEITQRASIKLPNVRKLLDTAEGEDERLRINVGDKVVVMLGYDEDMKEEFRGYVSEICPKAPVEIKCEDEIWKLKQETISQAWKSVKLSEVISFLYAGPKQLQVPDITLTNFRLNRTTRAKALEDIKDKLGLCCYFRGSTLFMGFPYYEKKAQVIYHFQKNIPYRQDNLIYKRSEDTKIKLTGISISRDNKKTEVQEGDAEGEERTIHFYNLTEKELRVQTQQALKRLKYNGYRGSFKTFGQPFATFNMVANIQDERFPNRNAKVFIDKVSTEYGPGGFSRTIEPGRSAG